MEVYKNGLRLTVTVEDRKTFEEFIKDEVEVFNIDAKFVSADLASSCLDRALEESHSRIKFSLVNLYTLFDKKEKKDERSV